MFVCQCAAVTDHTVEALVDEGCRDLCELADRCGAGARCGSCLPLLAELLEASHTERLGRVLVGVP